MSKIKVEFHRLALKEFDEARDWYAASSPETARRFKAAVEETVSRIAERPELFQHMSGQYRWARVRKFRYILVHRYRNPGEIVVVPVAHTSRRPGYWRRRT